ncbi:MAG: hypothetical protein ACN2B6_01310 [Rickettsiales bacterium]
MSDMGRPTAYKPEYADQAKKLCGMFGATDMDLSKYFGVTERTIYNWKHDHEDFFQALKSKKLANERVERSLYERATGYSHPEDKIFNNNGEEMIVETMKHYPPDTGAAIAWLANRDPNRWKKDPSGETNDSRQPITINLVNPHADSTD